MDGHCFYCDYEIEDGNEYHITVIKNFREQEEILCKECYFEWLEGIKG